MKQWFREFYNVLRTGGKLYAIGLGFVGVLSYYSGKVPGMETVMICSVVFIFTCIGNLYTNRREARIRQRSSEKATRDAQRVLQASRSR